VGALRRAVARIAAAQPGLRAGEAEPVATEPGTNLLRHAHPGGYVLVRTAGDGIELLSVDHGPGRPGASPGLGLPTTMRPEGVSARELARDRLVAVIAPDHPLADEPAVDLQRLSSEVFVDLPAKTAGRVQSDLAFSAAGLVRDVAFEVTNADFLARLVGQGLGVAMLPSAYAAQLSGVTTVEVIDAPARVEYIIWSAESRTPAATAFLRVLDVPDVHATP